MKYKRVLSLLLCLTIAIGCISWRPQKVDAIAVTSTAAIATGIAAIMTACGVTYWANSQQDAIDYITGKVSDYFNTLTTTPSTMEDWLGVTGHANLYTVVAGGAMRFTSGVASKILDFVSWLNQDEGITSGGQPVREFHIPTNFNYTTSGTYSGDWTCDIYDNNRIIINYSRVGGRNGAYMEITFPVHSDVICAVTVVQNNGITSGSFGSSPNNVNRSLDLGSSTSYIYSDGIGTLCIFKPNLGTIVLTGDVVIELSQGDGLDKTVVTQITPSANVDVPTVVSGENFDVSPSVTLAQGDTVDNATTALLDGITSVSGLSSTNDVLQSPSTGWEWLDDILSDLLSAIVSLPEAIFTRFTSILTDIKNGITSLASSIYSTFSEILTDIKSAIYSVKSTITSLPALIYERFASILSDIKTGIASIASDVVRGVSSALEDAFVPSDAYVQSFVAALNATFSGHFSILSYPFSILGEFITRATSAGSQEPIFQWPNVYEPFSSRLLIAAGSYNLNRSLDNTTFANLYSIYLIVIKGFLSFSFLKFLYAWFCDVFHMRESDFDAPDLGGDADDS